MFLRNFKINSIYLDPENPVNTNVHFAAQYIKGSFPVIILHTSYTQKKKNSPNFTLEIIEEMLIKPTIIFFNFTDPWLIEDYSSMVNIKSVYHFISTNIKNEFKKDYDKICKDIKFVEYEFDEEQFKHLKYRCEDILNQIKKSDIKKTKLKKICQELLHSKKMKNYFNENPNEKSQIIKTINENSIKRYKPSVGFLPSYLIHDNNKDNVIKSAIEESYFMSKKRAKQINNSNSNKNNKLKLPSKVLKDTANESNNDINDNTEINKSIELNDNYDSIEEYSNN